MTERRRSSRDHVGIEFRAGLANARGGRRRISLLRCILPLGLHVRRGTLPDRWTVAMRTVRGRRALHVRPLTNDRSTLPIEIRRGLSVVNPAISALVIPTIVHEVDISSPVVGVRVRDDIGRNTRGNDVVGLNRGDATTGGPEKARRNEHGLYSVK